MRTYNKGFMQKSLIVLLSLTTAYSAFAKDRFLVMYKSQQGFSAMSQHLMTVENSSIKLQSSLKYINGQVIKSSDLNAINQLKNHPEVLSVEAEYFFQLPKPTNGFSLNKKALLKASRPVSSYFEQAQGEDVAGTGTPVFKEGLATPWGIPAVKTGEAWALSKAGQGARVLVLDTGIDYEHPSLKANFEKGQNFYEEADGLDPKNFMDKEGHGTHCSGTIAGVYNENTGFTGVAPMAKLLMGRVCGEMGCSNIAVAQGINWGVQEKVDVISMSLGGSVTSSAERAAVANAEKAGVAVVAASGNSGTPKVSYPAALSTVVAVGAVDSSLTKTSFSQWGPELDIVAPGASVISSVPRGTGRDSLVDIVVDGQKARVKSAAFSGTKLFSVPKVGDLVPAGLGKKEDLAKVNVAGKIALISRGEIKFSEKIANALEAKAIGVVIYNNTTGLMQGSVTEDGSELDVAVVMVEQTLGKKLVDAITAGSKASAEISTTASDYAMFDGTSMATPHVAGVVALMKASNKKLTPAQIRTILSTTAVGYNPNPENQYGAGLVQADKAVAASVAQ